jgi:hypothetical protein
VSEARVLLTTQMADDEATLVRAEAQRRGWSVSKVVRQATLLGLRSLPDDEPARVGDPTRLHEELAVRAQLRELVTVLNQQDEEIRALRQLEHGLARWLDVASSVSESCPACEDGWGNIEDHACRGAIEAIDAAEAQRAKAERAEQRRHPADQEADS